MYGGDTYGGTYYGGDHTPSAPGVVIIITGTITCADPRAGLDSCAAAAFTAEVIITPLAGELSACAAGGASSCPTPAPTPGVLTSTLSCDR